MQGMYVCMSVCVCMYGWMDGWVGGWMGGCVDGGMGGWIYGPVFRIPESVSLGDYTMGGPGAWTWGTIAWGGGASDPGSGLIYIFKYLISYPYLNFWN